MASRSTTRPSYSSLLRQIVARPGHKGSKRRGGTADSEAAGEQHAQVLRCLTQAQQGLFFGLLRSLTLATIGPGAAPATLATQGNSVRLFTACRQPPTNVLASAFSAAVQLDSGYATSRTLWGLMPFKQGPKTHSSVPSDMEPQAIGAVYSRLSKDPLWLLSNSNDPPYSFGLMLEGRPRIGDGRDAGQCVLEFAQLADARASQEMARHWRTALAHNARHSATGHSDAEKPLAGQAKEEQQQEQQGMQAMYAYASAAAASGPAASSTRAVPASGSGVLEDADTARLVYAYAALAGAAAGDASNAHIHKQRQQQLGQAQEDGARVLQAFVSLAGQENSTDGKQQQRKKQALEQLPVGQDVGVLRAFAQLS